MGATFLIIKLHKTRSGFWLAQCRVVYKIVMDSKWQIHTQRLSVLSRSRAKTGCRTAEDKMFVLCLYYLYLKKLYSMLTD